jgi:hypothetical protein
VIGGGKVQFADNVLLDSQRIQFCVGYAILTRSLRTAISERNAVCVIVSRRRNHVPESNVQDIDFVLGLSESVCLSPVCNTGSNLGGPAM